MGPIYRAKKHQMITIMSMLFIIYIFGACNNDSVRQTNRTDVLAAMRREQAAGNPKEALTFANILTNTFKGTPEADTAAKQIPELQATIERIQVAERVRVAEETAAAEARGLAAKWTYHIEEDAMTSRKAKFASIYSENSVEFGFPYQGPQRGTLTIRDHPSYGHDVYLSIERGQILCQSYEDCEIKVRFDEREPESWGASASSDHSTTIIFLRNEARFTRKMRAAKVVRIQIPVYQEGQQVFEFVVGGFDYSRYQGDV